MDKDEISQERQEKFWGELGVRKANTFWITPNGDVWQALPIDLNNLFKYAPLLCDADLSVNFHEVHWVDGQMFTHCTITKDFNKVGEATVEGKLKEVAAAALFLAIEKILT
ncbi:hypothetical protein LCGC14_0535690 [marine sediment metagenome]|uniref:Uncharacterized protein n=1 Tax=marine sediment metagenome TaxID=412755 RepID=A0A0F9RUF6_9ZZZZ